MNSGNREVDRYRLLHCIATTKFSQLWEVSRADFPHRLAMKLLLPRGLSDPGEVKLLKHEAKVLTSLEHPNVISFRSSKVTNEFAYIVLELFRAPNLKSAMMADRANVQRHLEPIVESLCLVLAHVHERGWVHRDLKPENVLFSPELGLRLIDFSVAESFRQGVLGKLRRLKSRTIQGTREYIAPETIRKQNPNPQTDIYSLGAMFFELLAGHPPFRGTSPADLLQKHLSEKPLPPSNFNPNVTPELDALILRMLEKDPGQRPRTTMEVLGRFREIRPYREPMAEAASTQDESRKSGSSATKAARERPTSQSRPDSDGDLPMMEEMPPVK